jgi:uncharacterized protein YkwD
MHALRLHRLLIPVAVAAVAAVALVGSPAAQAQEACAGSSAIPGAVPARQVMRATLCELNAERTQRGLPKLRLNLRLSKAARRHSADMVANDYFSHESRSGASFVDRIRRSGYLRSVSAWSVGENLAWGTGSKSTPASITDSWMNSPGHRANILQGRYREVGIGVVSGAPTGSWDDAATYATEFGFRR